MYTNHCSTVQPSLTALANLFLIIIVKAALQTYKILKTKITAMKYFYFKIIRQIRPCPECAEEQKLALTSYIDDRHQVRGAVSGQIESVMQGWGLIF